MGQAADSQPLNPAHWLGVFLSASVNAQTQKALNSLCRYVGADCTAPLTATLLTDWVAALLVQGAARSTAGLYLDLLSALHTRCLGQSEAFARVKGLMRKVGRHDAEPLGKMVELARRLAAWTAVATARQQSVGADAVLLSLLTGVTPLAEIARWQQPQLAALQGEALQIARRNCSARRKYILPLRQPDLTCRQLTDRICGSASFVLRSHGLSMGSDPDADIAILWMATALAASVPLTVALASLGRNPFAAGFASTLVADAARIDPALAGDVAGWLSKNPLRWWVMRMRPRTDADTLKQRTLSSGLVEEWFYPTHSVARRTMAGVEFVERPVIPDTVFVRARVTSLRPLMASVGDMAWIYRNPGAAPGQYAPVADGDMAMFQRVTATFSASTQICQLGTHTLEPGQNVIIIGGNLKGLAAQFSRQVAHSGTGATLFRLTFGAANGFEWTADLDPRLVEPDTSTF